jgi:hypothetical protein
MRPVDGQHQNRRLLLALSYLGHPLGDLFSGGTHVQDPKALTQFLYHLVSGVSAQREAGKLREQFLGCLKRDLGS